MFKNKIYTRVRVVFLVVTIRHGLRIHGRKEFKKHKKEYIPCVWWHGGYLREKEFRAIIKC